MSTPRKKPTGQKVSAVKKKPETQDEPTVENGSDRSATEERIEHLQTQLNKARAAKQKTGQLEDEIGLLKKNITGYQEQIQTLTDQQKKLTKAFDNAEEKQNKLSAEKQELEKQLMDLQEKIKTAGSEDDEPLFASTSSKFRIELYYQDGKIPGRIEHIGTRKKQNFILSEPEKILEFLSTFRPTATADTVQPGSEKVAKPLEIPLDQVEKALDASEAIGIQQTPQKISVARDQPFQLQFQLALSDEVEEQCVHGAHEETSIYARLIGSDMTEKLLGRIVSDENSSDPVQIHVPANVLDPGLYRIDSKIDITPSATGKKLSAASDSGLIYIF
ncbi:MAG: hypothetical protein DWQ10_11865 [Calditrichaeota bacterium]|nr:MAG: hypothetical protein DWQ10_11865 [Calditrichota bacterium]